MLFCYHFAGLREAGGGSLDRVRRVLKILGFVNCVSGYTGQPDSQRGFLLVAGAYSKPHPVH